MLAPIALAAWGTRLVSYDATSPIKDAVQGTLYFSRPAQLKVRTRRAAYRLASQEGAKWRCPCPFCRRFAVRHPFDYSAGRKWFSRTRAMAVEAKDLRPGGGLFGAYPLLAEPATGALRKEVDNARMSHNHWALIKTLAAIGRAAESRESLAAHLERSVAAYERHTSADHYAAAVRLAFGIALGEATVT
jgi:hypothetical protein